MKEALKQVSLLVERFERNIEAYRSPGYNETQLRRKFIDPGFVMPPPFSNPFAKSRHWGQPLTMDKTEWNVGKAKSAEKGTVLFFKRVPPQLNVLLDDEDPPFPYEYILHTNTNIHFFFFNETMPSFLKVQSKIYTASRVL